MFSLCYVPDDRYMVSCLLFALKNIISRVYWGVLDNFWNFQGGGGVTASSLKWKIRRGGGSYMIFPSWWGYGYFLELHNYYFCVSRVFDLIFLLNLLFLLI